MSYDDLDDCIEDECSNLEQLLYDAEHPEYGQATLINNEVLVLLKSYDRLLKLMMKKIKKLEKKIKKLEPKRTDGGLWS